MINFIAAADLSHYGFRNFGLPYTNFSPCCVAQAVLSIAHAWLLWSASAFIESPPNILKLVCGYEPGLTFTATEQHEGNNEAVEGDDDITRAQLDNNEAAAATATADVNVDTVVGNTVEQSFAEAAMRRRRARRFVVNIIIAVSIFFSNYQHAITYIPEL